MLTLDDALNRNYYFYQSGEVNVDFVKSVFNAFLGYNYEKFIKGKMQRYIESGYSTSYAQERAEHQAVETCLSACKAIPRYRKEIKEHFKKFPGLRAGTTDERIDKMLYNELKDIRTHLGLSKRGKRVTTVEPAPERTVSRAKEHLKSKTSAEIVKDVISSNHEEELGSREKEDSSYTLAELREIVGYDITYEEAIRSGYHIDDAPTYERVEEVREPKKPLPPARTPSREELIAAINEELLEMPREVAENVYWYIQDKKLHGFGRSK